MKITIEIVMKKLLLILLVYGFFATLLVDYFNISFIDYLDEAITLIGLVYIVMKKLSNSKICVKKETLYLLIFAILGIIGNLRSGINTQYCILGMFLMLKSYVIYYSFEELNWTKKDVDSMFKILKWMYIVLITLGIVFYLFPEISPFSTFGMSSICNHPAIFATLLVPFIIYCFVEIVENRRNKLVVPLAIALICVLLANTSKNIVSIGVVGIIYMIASKKKKKYTVMIIAAVVLLFFAEPIISVLSTDYEAYILSETASNRPRMILLRTSLKIAKDYFPTGSGFGTYGSSVARTHYSEIYNQYGINGQNGLSSTNGIYLTDTYWPAIIGETGFIGAILMCLFLTKLIIRSVKNFRFCIDRKERILAYVAILSFIALVVESLFTSTFFSLRCYLGIGILGIYNSVMARNKERKVNEEYNLV